MLGKYYKTKIQSQNNDPYAIFMMPATLKQKEKAKVLGEILNK